MTFFNAYLMACRGRIMHYKPDDLYMAYKGTSIKIYLDSKLEKVMPARYLRRTMNNLWEYSSITIGQLKKEKENEV